VVEVTAGNSSVPAGYTTQMSFDHAAWVTAGNAAADGSDLSLFIDDNGTPVRAPFVLDPSSTWNASDTRLWFRLPQRVEQNTTDIRWRVSTLESGGGPSSETQVFHFADFFERADAELPGGAWTVYEDGTDIDLTSGALYFADPLDFLWRPLADADFNALDGRSSVVFGLDFAQGSEGHYRFHMQAGDGAQMDAVVADAGVSNTGVSFELIWTGPSASATVTNEETLAAGPNATAAAIGTVSGPTRVETVVFPGAGQFSVRIDGAPAAQGLTLLDATAQLDRLRLFTWEVSSNVAGRRVDYVWVRPLVSIEPSTEVTVACP
jgi:hypothetical protein